MKPAHSIGLTATPYRDHPKDRLTYWDDICYRLSVDEALEDGIIVPFSIHSYEGNKHDIDEAAVEVIHGAIKQGIGAILVNATDIEDAEAFADYLQCEGIRAEAIHSKLDARQQAQRMESLRTGALQVMVHVSLLTEGANYPWLEAMVLRRGAGGKRSRVAHVQEVGRVLRVCKETGKTRAHVFDVVGLFENHGMTYAAAVGQLHEPEIPGFRESIIGLSGGGRAKHNLDKHTRAERHVRRQNFIGGLLRRLVSSLETCGLTPVQSQKRTGADDRLVAPDILRRILHLRPRLLEIRPRIPPDPTRALELLWSHLPLMRHRAGSDFLRVLKAIVEHQRWPKQATELLHANPRLLRKS